MTYHTAMLLLLITFWAIILYSYSHPLPPVSYRHQRSYPRFYPNEMRETMYQTMGPMDRPMYRRSTMYESPIFGPPRSYQQEPPRYPQYPQRDGSSLIVLPRGVDEEYEMYPLKTKMLEGFDAEDEDMIHEEEMGDQLELLDKQAPTRYISESVAKKPKPAPTFQMEMAPPQRARQFQNDFEVRQQFPRPERYQKPLQDDFEYYSDDMYPMPHHPQKRYQPNYQYYHQNPDYYNPRYMEPEPLYAAPPLPSAPMRRAPPKARPGKLPKLPQVFEFEEEDDGDLEVSGISSEGDDIFVKVPLQTSSKEVVEFTEVDVSDGGSVSGESGYYEEESTVMPQLEEAKAQQNLKESTQVTKEMQTMRDMQQVTMQAMRDVQQARAQQSESSDQSTQEMRSTQESQSSQEE